jgi:transcriptional regulator with XRE-family HTH domain
VASSAGTDDRAAMSARARKEFGQRVRRLRERAGYSQESFALFAEIGRSYYAQIERGEVNLCLDMMVRIATALGVPPAALFQWHKP